MSEWPLTRESKARCLPSGDQRGVPVGGPRNVVICTASAPAEVATQISWLPDRLETNAMCASSGENAGCHSSRVESISRVGAADGVSDAGPGVRQIFQSARS